MQELSLEKFDSILQTSGELNVIMCSAVWCSACRAVTPILEQLANEITNVQFYKADVDVNTFITIKYGISSIPAILFIKDGELLEKHIGALSKTPLKRKIESHLQ